MMVRGQARQHSHGDYGNGARLVVPERLQCRCRSSFRSDHIKRETKYDPHKSSDV